MIAYNPAGLVCLLDVESPREVSLAEPLPLELYEYDGLHRLIEANRGAYDWDQQNPQVLPAAGSENWDLDVVGNHIAF